MIETSYESQGCRFTATITSYQKNKFSTFDIKIPRARCEKEFFMLAFIMVSHPFVRQGLKITIFICFITCGLYRRFTRFIKLIFYLKNIRQTNMCSDK